MHSYMVGVYTSESMAWKAALEEEESRGGKYTCEIDKWDITNGKAELDPPSGENRDRHKVIKRPNGIKESLHSQYSRVVHQRFTFGPRDDR